MTNFYQKNMLVIFLVIMVFSSCAHRHTNSISTRLNQEAPELLFSASNIESPNGSPFQLVELTIENTGEHWIRVDSARIQIGQELLQKLSVVEGQDLYYWTEAKILEERQKEHNKSFAQIGMITLGTALSAAGQSHDNDFLQITGALSAIAGTGWILKDTVSYLHSHANELEQRHPDNHLYSSFSVPPGMRLKRWVLLNKPRNQNITNLVINVNTIEGESGQYAITI